ncbi:TPA: ATPase, partial [Candidatus Bathyarchaeota archaeon]|nr:ATPase [Candidatus Bathyarchaeota archaeon]
MVLVVGLDSGATKSVCAIADEAGRVLGVGSSGGGNYHVVGVKAARDNVLEAVEEARAQARIEETFDVGCFGMGGLDSKHDYETISGFLRPLNLARRYVIVNDVVIAYHAVTAGERPGAVVVGGTGSIAYGMNEMGDEARSGGWGWIMGDEGSALDISRRALMAAAKAYDGRGPGTVLVELFERHFGVDRYEDVIPLIYTRGVGP